MVIPREPRLFIKEGGDSVETTRQHLLQTTKAYLLVLGIPRKVVY
ncbi:MAG: hypothetical protein BWY24_00580 [Microgenomates group bacterium ADurb.Bin219]|nr:MAG: hypothetical protein BWY24_00580 [Microgenomates group bacterium ADurb.Bin219]